MKIKIFFGLIISVLFGACVVEEPDLSRYEVSEFDNVEEAKDIKVTYTDSTQTLFILEAPKLRRLLSRYSVKDEFPEGIKVTFFDDYGRERSWLTADYAIRDQANKTITVQRNVVLLNDVGERLDGPELIWDEKSKEITTDRFVKIRRADGSVVYSHGIKSNEGFTRYELFAVSGDMNVAQKEARVQGDGVNE